jgi:arylsulfatase A-like enzyme
MPESRQTTLSAVAHSSGLQKLVCLVFIAILVIGTGILFADEKPNMIVTLIDDMGYSDLGCFGGTLAPTPNLDRLASEGIRFRSFYVNSPICSPSRTALTTGQYPHRLRITSYLDNRKRNKERGVAQWLDPETPTIADRLKKVGYTTGHFGKWHMGGQRDVGDAPLITEYGFDRSLTNFEGLGPRVLPLNEAFNGKPAKKHDLGSAGLGKGPIRWANRSEITGEFVADAIQFIQQVQSDGKPFYLNLWPDDVHSPFFPTKSLRDSTDESKRSLYYAVLQAMDQQLGLLLDHVRNDDALRRNTLIVVASDNGHEDGAGTSEPLRGGKTWLYEGGIRSPLIVWGPGLVAKEKAETINADAVLCALDLNRSLTAIGGASIENGAACDGEDLSALLLGRSSAGRQAPIFWRRPPDRPGTAEQDNPDLAVRDGKWKLLINYDRTMPQLYDLQTDQSETRNVASEQSDLTARLTELVFRWNSALPVDAGDPAFRP